MRKKLIIGVLAFIGLFFLFLIWFEATYSMDVIASYEIGNSNASHKVLVASQGSEYKIRVVDDIVKHNSEYDIYYKIIDVSRLKEVSPEDWDAIILLHTWEIWKPEANTEEFVEKHYDQTKMLVLCTSGSGDNQLEGVDGITSASDLTQIKSDSKKIFEWLDQTLLNKID